MTDKPRAAHSDTATGNQASHVPGGPKYDQAAVRNTSALVIGVLPGIAAASVLPAGGWWDALAGVATSALVTTTMQYPGGVASLFSDSIHPLVQRSNAWWARLSAVAGSWVLTAGWAAWTMPQWLAGAVATVEAVALGAAWVFQRNRSWLHAYGSTRASQRYMDRWAARVEARDVKARAEVAELRDDAERLHLEAQRLFAAAEQAKREADLAPVAAELAADVEGPDAARQEAALAGQDADRRGLRDLVARELLAGDPQMSGSEFARQLAARGYGMSKGPALTLRKTLLIELATLADDRARDAAGKVEGS